MPKDRRVTSQMVADRAGVSRTAVSFVLNGDPHGKISPETKRRIHMAMKELNYKPNLLARSMRTKRTQTIGIITAGIAGGWFTRIVLGAEKALREEGYNILLGSISQDHTKAKSMKSSIDLLLSRQVDGLIIITGSEHQDEKALTSLIDSGVPAVLVNYYGEDQKHFGLVYVGYREAAINAVEHLCSIGRRRIAFLGGPLEGRDSTGFTRDIYYGYKQGLKKCSLLFSEELVRLWNVIPEYLTWGREMVKEILPQKPDAIYCLNDYVAFGVLSYLHTLGLSIPDDIAVVGNDNIEASKYIDPPLTSVDMMLEECGEQAAKLLLQTLNGEESLLPLFGPVKVKVRASTIGLK